MTSVLRSAKNALFAGAQLSGASALLRDSNWRQRRLLVVCYHGVSLTNEHEWSDLYVSQEHLRRRMHWLRKNRYAILPLADALDRLAAGTLPHRAVAVTFDDGAADFYTRAYPVLKEFDVPTMLYQTTWYVDREQPVFNTMSSFLFWHARGRSVHVPWRAEPSHIPQSVSSAEFRALHREAREQVLQSGLDAGAQMELLAKIARACGVNFQSLLSRRQLFLMSSDELRLLDPSLVDIQLHTHRHRTPESRQLYIRELKDNEQALVRILQRPLRLRHFCYPSGVYRPEHGTWLREEGIASATTCDPSIATKASDVMFLPRFIDTMGTPDPVFEAFASGIASLARRQQR